MFAIHVLSAKGNDLLLLLEHAFFLGIKIAFISNLSNVKTIFMLALIAFVQLQVLKQFPCEIELKLGKWMKVILSLFVSKGIIMYSY